MTAAKRAATSIADAIAAAHADLDQLRDRIGDLLTEQREVNQTSVDRAEAARRVDAIIGEARASALFDRPEIFEPEGGRPGQFFMDALRRDPLAALAAVCPDGLKAAFLASHPGGGLSPDGRAARLTKIEHSLFAASVAEEIACRELESATGGTVMRRLDADPAIVLAPTAELEGDTP